MGDQIQSLAIPPERVFAKMCIEQLKSEILALQMYRDELIYVECPNLAAIYHTKIGTLEYEILSCSFEAQELKRRIELVQERINKRVPLDLVEIDAIIRREFAIFQKELKWRLTEISQANYRLAMDVLSPEDTEELKHLYRTIMKALHPDLNPNLSEAQYQIFLEALDAFERGDIDKMRVLILFVEDPQGPGLDYSNKCEVKAEIMRLKKAKANLMKAIENIKSSFPYDMKEFLMDPRAVREKRKELRQIIREWQETNRSLRKRLRETIRKAYSYEQSSQN